MHGIVKSDDSAFPVVVILVRVNLSRVVWRHILWADLYLNRNSWDFGFTLAACTNGRHIRTLRLHSLTGMFRHCIIFITQSCIEHTVCVSGILYGVSNIQETYPLNYLVCSKRGCVLSVGVVYFWRSREYLYLIYPHHLIKNTAISKVGWGNIAIYCMCNIFYVGESVAPANFVRTQFCCQ